jgi:hypothetical protein
MLIDPKGDPVVKPCRLVPVFFLVAFLVAGGTALADSSRVHVNDGSDERAIEIAQATVQAMGGWEALDATRFVSWKFFGRRQHYWDRRTGDIRIETERDDTSTIILMNIHTKKGRAFKDAVELKGDELTEMMEGGHQAWVNDAYWMFMPYKLLDPGVTLTYAGEKSTASGNDAWVLDLTFSDGVGYTPENRYHVYVGKESGLVEQWDFFADASMDEPNFASPWKDWKTFGRIRLATNHGRDLDWNIGVHDAFAPGLLTDPTAVAK